MPIYQHILTVNNLLSTIHNPLFTIYNSLFTLLILLNKRSLLFIHQKRRPVMKAADRLLTIKIGTDFCQSRFNQLIWQFLYLWRVVKYNRFLNVNILS